MKSDAAQVDPREEAKEVRQTLAFLSSALRSREPWTDTAEANYRGAQDALDRLEREALRRG